MSQNSTVDKTMPTWGRQDAAGFRNAQRSRTYFRDMDENVGKEEIAAAAAKNIDIILTIKLCLYCKYKLYLNYTIYKITTRPLSII